MVCSGTQGHINPLMDAVSSTLLGMMHATYAVTRVDKSRQSQSFARSFPSPGMIFAGQVSSSHSFLPCSGRFLPGIFEYRLCAMLRYSRGCRASFLNALFKGRFRGHQHSGLAVRVLPETGFSFGCHSMRPFFQILMRVVQVAILSPWIGTLTDSVEDCVSDPSESSTVFLRGSLDSGNDISFGHHLTSSILSISQKAIFQQVHVPLPRTDLSNATAATDKYI